MVSASKPSSSLSSAASRTTRSGVTPALGIGAHPTDELSPVLGPADHRCSVLALQVMGDSHLRAVEMVYGLPPAHRDRAHHGVKHLNHAWHDPGAGTAQWSCDQGRAHTR